MAGVPAVGLPAVGLPAPARNQPSPWMATSSALPVVWMAPLVIRLSIVPSVTPRPIWAELAPPKPAPEAELVRISCWSWSLNVVRAPLKPTVLTLARSLAATSSMTCWVFRPETALNIPRIMGASLSWGLDPRLPQGRSGRDSADDGRVDVGEHVLAHGLRVDRGDHGLVADGDDERRPVEKDHGLPCALRGRAVHGAVQAREGLRARVDAPALHPLERVAGELHALRALLEHLGERGARGRGGFARARRGDAGADGRDERGIVDRRAHMTLVSWPVVRPATPATVRVGTAPERSTASTLPVVVTPLASW